jgi:hypothetical protein
VHTGNRHGSGVEVLLGLLHLLERDVIHRCSPP